MRLEFDNHFDIVGAAFKRITPLGEWHTSRKKVGGGPSGRAIPNGRSSCDELARCRQRRRLLRHGQRSPLGEIIDSFLESMSLAACG